MPRLARVVAVGTPHHITQRGNRGEPVFFSDRDRRIYLQWLKEYSEKQEVEILAYCLMTNHVHIIAVPSSEEGLHLLFRPLHMRYAQRINRLFDWHGHLWQGRFFASVLDERYMWAAIRYVERNPVRAKLIRKAEEYPWSSAAMHCGLKTDPLITQNTEWKEIIEQNREDWSEWLTEENDDEVEIIRRNTHRGLPCGNESFIKDLEQRLCKKLEYRPPHRPRKR